MLKRIVHVGVLSASLFAGVAQSAGDGVEIVAARDLFLAANDAEGAHTNAVDEAALYFVASLGSNVFPMAKTNLVRSAKGNWIVNYMFDVDPAFWYTSFIMSDGQILDANETNAVTYLKAEHAGVLTAEARPSVLNDAARFLYRGRPLSSAQDIRGYEEGMLSSNVVADIEASWNASNATPLVRYYWNADGGDLWRGILEVTESNTLSNVVFTNVSTQVGETNGPFM